MIFASRHGWMLLLAVLLISGCTQAVDSPLIPTQVVVPLNITPAARPVIPALTACDAALPGLRVEIEERFISQTNIDFLIRLGVPEDSPGFLAQIATDELALVLHPDNPAGSLTPEEIQAIFSGQVSDWTAFNGSDAPVQVWVPLAVDETRLAFDSRILQGLPVVSDAGITPDPAAMQTIIAANPGAVGYLPVSWQPSGLHTILLGIRLPVLVASSQPIAGPAADLVACLQGEIGQQALEERYP